MWHFRQMGRAEMNTDPTEGDFFNVDVLENMADALVRETIQNSLDARRTDETSPVEVRFRLQSASADAEPAISQYFSGLWPHVEATNVLDEPPDSAEPVCWLTIEDYGTRGLLGDPAASDDPRDGNPNDFYYFWRNVGRGQKAGSERGRWGLGKTVFPAASRLNAFFGLTLRSDDRRHLLMGQCVLKIHHIGEAKHYPYGYFGMPDDDGFVRPLSSTEEVSGFTRTFGVDRTSEPGLSIVIPYVRNAIDSPALLAAVLRHYYYPILAGQLEVTVVDADSSVTLTRDNLEAEAPHILGGDSTSLIGMLSLAKEYLSFPPDSIVTGREQAPTVSPRWTEDIFGAEMLERMAQEFDAGKTLAAKIPVHVKPKAADAQLSHFHLILKRDPDLDSAEDAYIRQGITISGVTSSRETGIRAMVIAQDDVLAAFLGDAENPAHTEWQPRSRNFKGKYVRGPSTLEFVKTAPRSMMRLLNRRSEMIDETALRRFFPAPDSSSPPTRRQGSSVDRNPTRTAANPPVVRSRPKRIAISKTAHGFTVSLTEQGKQSLPMDLAVRCAYDTGRGNPFRRWTEADFDLSKLEAQITGAELVSMQGNRLKLRVYSPDFSASASGFDSRRDVIVDARTEESGNA